MVSDAAQSQVRSGDVSTTFSNGGAGRRGGVLPLLKAPFVQWESRPDESGLKSEREK